MASIDGTVNSELLIGTADGDRINGLDGNDTLFGSGGNDTLFGGTGDDLYIYARGGGTDIVGDGMNGTNDRLLILGYSASDVRLTTNSADQLVLNFDATGDSVLISEHMNFVSIETVIFGDGTSIDLTGGLTLTGAGGDDHLWGTSLDDMISGRAGADVLYGQSGSDTIRGGGGNDLIYGDTNIAVSPASDDTDLILGGAGNDTVIGGGGNDTVTGGAGNDSLYAHAGSDIVTGGAGADTINGGLDDDVLTGGADADVFQFEADGARDTVMDFVSGTDVLDFSYAAVGAGDLVFSQINDGTDLLIDAGVTQVVLEGLTQADIDFVGDFVF